jgi:hypothetical protein
MDASLRIREIEEKIGIDPNQSLDGLLEDLGINEIDTFFITKDRTINIENTDLPIDDNIEFRKEEEL